jgi:hypothetical protein
LERKRERERKKENATREENKINGECETKHHPASTK